MTQSYVHIRLRRDTSNNWSTNNPILKVGEPGLETDTRKLKFGDGVTSWNNLQYSGIDINDSVVLENIDDRVAGLIKAGSNISISYNDNSNELTISAVGLQLAGDYANLVNGRVPASQLPSYVDDVIEVANFSTLPSSGESGKIYVTLENNKTYRWSGSIYVEISASPGSTDAVPEGSVNKYYTDARASAAAPVQSVAGKTGVVTLTKDDVGLSNVDNTSDVNKPVSTAQAAADSAVQSAAASDAATKANNAQAFAVQRNNHTGTQAIGTVDGLQTVLDSKAATNHTHTSEELFSSLSEPGTKNIYVDNGRTDTYTADGSQYKPFKTMRAALASVSSASSLADMNDTTKRFYCFRIAPGFYDEESGGTLNIPFRPGVVFDVTGGATLKGNYLWSRPANVVPATTGGNTNPVTSATTTGSNTITVSTSHVNYSRLKVGTIMTGTGMPTNTVITAINGSTITLNNTATATNASASLSFDSGELNNFVFAMIGSNHRPMFNNGQHSFVGIQGNLTVHTVDTLGFNQVHLTNCGVRGVIEATSTSSGGSTMHLYAYQNATFDTLKATGTHGITLYAVDCQNSTGGNGFGNIIGNVAFNTLEQVFFHSWASIFSTGRHGVFNMDATFMPAYNEIKATSFTRTNNVATVTLSLNHGQSRNILPDGYWREQYVLINGVTENTSFNTPNFGAKVVDFPTANTVSYENTGPDVSVAVTAANAKWIKGAFFGNSNTAGYIQPNPVSLSLNEGAIHTHPGWNTNTQPGLGSAFITARSSGVTFRYPAIGWAANAQYVRNRILLPGNGYQYRNVTATGIGRSGATAPTWPTTIGGTVVDGSITWQCEQLSFPLSFSLGFTGSITSGSNQVTVTSVGSVLAANFQVGYVITGTGIPANTTITAISGATLTISANATATNANVTLTVAGTSAISYNVQHALEVLHDSRNIYHNQIDSGIAGAATVQQAFKSLKANVDLKANINSPTFTGTVSGITKSMVGLGNVDNTSDVNKPVSTAQASADSAVQSAAASDAATKANNAQAFAVQRSNHTGTQAISTVDGLQTALDGKAPTNHNHTSGSITDFNTAVSNIVSTDLVAGNGIVLTYDNINDNIVVSTTENPSILALGSVSGSNAISFGTDRLIQTLTLNGTATTFTKGINWPDIGTLSADVILRITVTSATSITWTIVNDWFNQPPAGALSVGTHLFLLRAIGSSIIEGHYIGNKTN